MAIVTPRKPSGFSEYLPAEQLEFNRLLDIIRATYEKYGFTPIDTPDLELTDVLLAKGGGETEQQVYSFKREGSDTDLTLRYDLTVPLARYVAEHQSNLVFPFRRYHIGKVHRAERAQAGRFREFYQCDIDTIGSNSPLVDAEFPIVINDVFEQFGFGEFTIRINNRLVLNGFFESIGLQDVSRDVLRTIDKIEKITVKEFQGELAKIGLSQQQIEQVSGFTSINGSNDEMLQQLRRIPNQSAQLAEGIDRLEILIENLRAANVPEQRFQIDLKIARGLDYYTGTVYETILTDYPQIGSVCSGGRYDDLASYYSKTKLPGVGISIGLSRMFYALKELGAIKADQQTPAKVIVLPISANEFAYATAVATELRSAGINTVLYTEPDKVGQKFRYASRQGFGYAVVVGEGEVKKKSVTIKNLVDGKSQLMKAGQLTNKLFK